MNQKKNILSAFVLCGVIALAPYWLPAVSTSSAAQNETARESTVTSQQPVNATRAARDEKTLQDARRQQLAEKEAALAAKEQELKKMSDKIEAQVKTLEESKKRLDDSLKQKNMALDEKRKRMLTLLKKMRPEQAGQFLAKMDEGAIISILNDLNNKVVLKLIPYLNQPMVLKWIKDNLDSR